MKPIKLPLDKITVSERLRTELGDIPAFAESIRDVGGLIHPVAVDENCRLIAGGRRYASYTHLHKTYPTEGWDWIPVTSPENLDGSLTKLRMLELEENLRRKSMTWKEEVIGIAELYAMHGREKHMKGEKWGLALASQLFNMSVSHVHNVLKVADALKDPKSPVQKAEGILEALRMLLQAKQDEAERRIAELTIPKEATTPAAVDEILTDLFSDLPGEEKPALTPAITTPLEQYAASKCKACEGTGVNSKGDTCPICQGVVSSFVDDSVIVPFSRMFFKGRSEELITKLPDECFDHIHTDVPYGVDVDMMKQENSEAGMKDLDRIRDTHDVKQNLELFEFMAPQIFRVLKDKGFFVFWYDNEHWKFHYDICIKAGFKVTRWPLVWCKTGPTKNEAAFFNFGKATETAMVCRKGTATLVTPMTQNYFLCGPPDKLMFNHPFAKPVGLLEWVFKAIAKPGQTTLDPFAGSGTIPYAAAKCGLKPHGFELEEYHYNNLITTMRAAYEGWMLPRKVKFE